MSNIDYKETYTPDWDFVSGSLDSTFIMLACPKEKYKEVTINLTPQIRKEGDKTIHGLNYGIAKIDLHNGTFGSASKVFEDSTKLAEQISKRWNEYSAMQDTLTQYKEALREAIDLFYEHEDGYIFQNVHEWQQKAHKLLNNQ